VNGEVVYVVHNVRHVGFARRQRLEDAMRYSAHTKIAWIKRPVIENSALSNPDLLKKLGFDI
jgi:hypothetical protein